MSRTSLAVTAGAICFLESLGYGRQLPPIILPTKTFTVYKVEIQSPTGDPVAAPALTNQFTLAGANGVATIAVQAVVTPSRVTADVSNLIKWSFASLPAGVTITWNNPWPGDSTSGQGASAIATLTGYPANNSDFGLRTLNMVLIRQSDGKVFNQRSTNIELFYKRDDVAAGRTVPNWFFYWGQVVAGTANAQYVSALSGGDFGETPAMLFWRTFGGSRQLVQISDAAHLQDSRRDGSNQVITGIDLFANTVAHENTHVLQITQENAQPFFSGRTGVLRNAAAAGWSFNVAFSTTSLWNHFTDNNHNGVFDAGDTNLDPDFDDDAISLEPTAAQEAQCSDGNSDLAASRKLWKLS